MGPLHKMMYLVYPLCTLLVWLALAVVTQGFVFVDVQELILLWVPGWLLYNRVVGVVADSGSVLRQAVRLGSILAALGLLWVMVSALLWSVFSFGFGIYPTLRGWAVASVAYFLVSVLAFWAGRRLARM